MTFSFITASILRASFRRYQLHILLLLVWIGLGAGLRWMNLAEKPLWTDEFATIVFSLGNSFTSVPIDQVITAEQLLAPLRLNPAATVGSVLHHLLTESNHPPLYFVLNHLWLRLFPTADGYVSVPALRSLPAFFGVLSIPATFGLAWLMFRSLSVAQWCAGLMAVSPFAIALAHEARHYTLPLLWIIGSLACLAIAVRRLQAHRPLPGWVCSLWIGVNGLGIATHYFFMLTLLAEAIVIVKVWGKEFRCGKAHWGSLWSSRIALVGVGTAASALVWLPFLVRIQDTQLTEWIYRRDTGLSPIGPIVQTLAGWLTMLYLLPVQVDSEWVKQISGAILILLLIWTAPKLIRGIRQLYVQPETKQAAQTLGGFVAGAIAIFMGLTYGFGMDLPSAFRYNFVYFPAAIILVGAVLANGWSDPSPPTTTPNRWRKILSWLSGLGRRSVLIILVFSLLGGLTVSTDMAYKKPHRPEVVAEEIREALANDNTTLIAIPHYTHGQTGRLMGIAWELRRQMRAEHIPAEQMPQFLLAHEDGTLSSLHTLRDRLMAQSRPFDVWLLNFPLLLEDAEPWSPLREASCRPRSHLDGVDGYRYQHFRCELRR